MALSAAGFPQMLHADCGSLCPATRRPDVRRRLQLRANSVLSLSLHNPHLYTQTHHGQKAKTQRNVAAGCSHGPSERFLLMLSPDPTSDKTGIRCSASGVPRHTTASLKHYQPLTVKRRSLMRERKKKIAPYRRHRSVLVDASS